MKIDKKGFSLVEALIAVMITGIAVTAIFSVMLSSHTSQGKSDASEEAARAINAAMEKLKPYVRADDNEFPEAMKLKGLCPGDSVDAFSLGKNHDASCFIDKTKHPTWTLKYDVMTTDDKFVPPSGVSENEVIKKVTFTIDYGTPEAQK